MTATAAPKKKSRIISGINYAGNRSGAAAASAYRFVRSRAGKGWAPVAPVALGGVEYAAHDYIPQIEKAEVADDMIVTSAGALAVGVMLTGALKGFGVNVDTEGAKWFIQGVSIVAGAAVNLTTGVHAPGEQFAEVSAPTPASVAMTIGAGVLGALAGYSSGRALTR